MSSSGEESTSSRYFKLGLFSLAACVLLVAGVIVLGAGELFRHTVPAETLVYESVNGLDVGSAVKFRGVPIGKVTGILFASSKYPMADSAVATARGANEATQDVSGILIEMSLDVAAFPDSDAHRIVSKGRQMVDHGLRARVTPAGISGQSYVEFDLLDPSQNPPPPIAWTPNVLYIPSAPGAIGQVLDAVEKIASDLQKSDLRKVVGHFDDLATRATSTMGDVQQLVAANRENVTRTLTELPATAARLRATAERADEILHDPRVEKGIAGFSGVGESATTTLADVRQLAHQAQQLLDGEGDDIRSILTDLRRFAADGAALTDDARANPSRLLFGKPPPPDAPRPVQGQ